MLKSLIFHLFLFQGNKESLNKEDLRERAIELYNECYTGGAMKLCVIGAGNHFISVIFTKKCLLLNENPFKFLKPLQTVSVYSNNGWGHFLVMLRKDTQKIYLHSTPETVYGTLQYRTGWKLLEMDTFLSSHGFYPLYPKTLIWKGQNNI